MNKNNTTIVATIGIGLVVAFMVIFCVEVADALVKARENSQVLEEKAVPGDPTSWISGCVTSTNTGETMFLLRGHEVGLLAPGEDCIKGMERMFWEEYREKHQ